MALADLSYRRKEEKIKKAPFMTMLHSPQFVLRADATLKVYLVDYSMKSSTQLSYVLTCQLACKSKKKSDRVGVDS